MRPIAHLFLTSLLATALAACGGGGGGAGVASAAAAEPAVTAQEAQCEAAGWKREVLSAAGLQRLVLWKAPSGPWTRGAVVVMHGGGGSHTNFCVANVELIAAQVRFTELALAQGFAVFLLDSSDAITDNEGRLCGKVWDDEVRGRPNLDLPFIEDVLRRVIPAARPSGSRSERFVTGLSSGAFMTVRSASRLGELITAFAPVAGGDPYGWFRDCTRRAGDRANVAGVGLDSETRRQISEPDACRSAGYANEKPWEGTSTSRKPPFRVFHHLQDGILDRSCVDKLRAQLLAHGHAETPTLSLDGGSRSVDVHYWQDAYNAPLLDFFSAQLGR